MDVASGTIDLKQNPHRLPVDDREDPENDPVVDQASNNPVDRSKEALKSGDEVKHLISLPDVPRARSLSKLLGSEEGNAVGSNVIDVTSQADICREAGIMPNFEKIANTKANDASIPGATLVGEPTYATSVREEAIMETADPTALELHTPIVDTPPAVDETTHTTEVIAATVEPTGLQPHTPVDVTSVVEEKAYSSAKKEDVVPTAESVFESHTPVADKATPVEDGTFTPHAESEVIVTNSDAGSTVEARPASEISLSEGEPNPISETVDETHVLEQLESTADTVAPGVPVGVNVPDYIAIQEMTLDEAADVSTAVGAEFAADDTHMAPVVRTSASISGVVPAGAVSPQPFKEENYDVATSAIEFASTFQTPDTFFIAKMETSAVEMETAIVEADTTAVETETTVIEEEPPSIEDDVVAFEEDPKVIGAETMAVDAVTAEEEPPTVEAKTIGIEEATADVEETSLADEVAAPTLVESETHPVESEASVVRTPTYAEEREVSGAEAVSPAIKLAFVEEIPAQSSYVDASDASQSLESNFIEGGHPLTVEEPAVEPQAAREEPLAVRVTLEEEPSATEAMASLAPVLEPKTPAFEIEVFEVETTTLGGGGNALIVEEALPALGIHSHPVLQEIPAAVVAEPSQIHSSAVLQSVESTIVYEEDSVAVETEIPGVEATANPTTVVQLAAEAGNLFESDIPTTEPVIAVAESDGPVTETTAAESSVLISKATSPDLEADSDPFQEAISAVVTAEFMSRSIESSVVSREETTAVQEEPSALEAIETVAPVTPAKPSLLKAMISAEVTESPAAVDETTAGAEVQWTDPPAKDENKGLIFDPTTIDLDSVGVPAVIEPQDNEGSDAAYDDPVQADNVDGVKVDDGEVGSSVIQSNFPPPDLQRSVTATAILESDEVALDTVAPPQNQLIEQSESTATLLTAVDCEIERPKSPWTPSYSVTTQGPGVPAEICEPQLLSPSVTDTPEILHDKLDNDTPVIGLVVPTLAETTPKVENSHSYLGEVDDITLQLTDSPPVDVEEARPKSPWTPTTQGIPLRGTAELPPAAQIHASTEAVLVDRSIVDSAKHPVLIVDSANIDESHGDSEAVINLPSDIQNLSAITESEDLTNDPIDAIVYKPSVETTTQEVFENPQAVLENKGIEVPETQDDLKDAALWTPQEDPVPDRPRSPWTPSYSVTTQGSPLRDTADLTQDEPLPSVVLVNDRAIACTVVPSAHTSVEEHNQLDEPFLTAKDRVENPTSALESSKVEEYTNKSLGILEVPTNPLFIQNLSSEADDSTIDPLALGDEHGVEKTFNISQHSPTILASESEAVTDMLQETTAVSRLTPQEDPNQDRPKSPWTPSYSVTRQGSGLLDDSIDDEEIGGLEPLPDRAVDHLADIAQSPPTSAGVPGSDISDSRSVAETSVVLETPATLRSPFKGFISNVDTLSAVPAAKSGPNSLRPGPLRVDLVPGNVSEHIPVEHNDLSPSHTSLISDTLGSEGVSARSASESRTHEAHQSPEQSRDQQSVQETPGPTENAPSEADDPKRQVFPTSVNVADEPQKSVRKPSVSRLTPVDENAGADADATSTSLGTPPPNPRARLESTASSRFFPGGWFSSAPRVLNEGRTSLDIAQGEFTPSKASPPIVDMPAADVPTTHTPVGDAETQEERKTKWCIVM